MAKFPAIDTDQITCRKLNLGNSKPGSAIVNYNSIEIVDPTTLSEGDFWLSPSGVFKYYVNGTTYIVGTTAGVLSSLASGTEYTLTYSTADETLSAFTPDDQSGAYIGIDNVQGSTPYATVEDLNNLRVAYENLQTAHVDLLQLVVQLVTDLSTIGVVTVAE